jgi:hypothetical protein
VVLAGDFFDDGFGGQHPKALVVVVLGIEFDIEVIKVFFVEVGVDFAGAAVALVALEQSLPQGILDGVLGQVALAADDVNHLLQIWQTH